MSPPKEKLPTTFGNRKRRRLLESKIRKLAKHEAKPPVHKAS